MATDITVNRPFNREWESLTERSAFLKEQSIPSIKFRIKFFTEAVNAAKEKPTEGMNRRTKPMRLVYLTIEQQHLKRLEKQLKHQEAELAEIATMKGNILKEMFVHPRVPEQVQLMLT